MREEEDVGQTHFQRQLCLLFTLPQTPFAKSWQCHFSGPMATGENMSLGVKSVCGVAAALTESLATRVAHPDPDHFIEDVSGPELTQDKFSH
ncbi:unnamed protein product [Leuciscus chuanchicus]